MQEGSEELGAGHEDTVGQQEVTEECLCWAGLGIGRNFRSQVIAQLYEQREHISPSTAQARESMPSLYYIVLHPDQEHFLPTAYMDQSSP